jgi:hypothetical protein
MIDRLKNFGSRLPPSSRSTRRMRRNFRGCRDWSILSSDKISLIYRGKSASESKNRSPERRRTNSLGLTLRKTRDFPLRTITCKTLAPCPTCQRRRLCSTSGSSGIYGSFFGLWSFIARRHEGFIGHYLPAVCVLPAAATRILVKNSRISSQS